VRAGENGSIFVADSGWVTAGIFEGDDIACFDVCVSGMVLAISQARDMAIWDSDRAGDGGFVDRRFLHASDAGGIIVARESFGCIDRA
jgi:hypothetical protein